MPTRQLILAASMMALAACSQAEPDNVETNDVVVETSADMMQGDGVGTAETDLAAQFDAAALQASLDAQDEGTKARYDARNPAATLEFFGIAPGMAVGEALPGGGWYTKILLPYLGDNGRLVGVDYSIPMWSEFGGFADEEFLAAKENWPAEWTEQARGWTDSAVAIDAATFENLPNDESLDAFLFIRAMHNLARFEAVGGYMTDAISSVYDSLKPGGLVGVVQHAAPDDADAEWASGAAGYLRQSDVVAAFEAAGFILVGESDINANPLDNPTTDDIVWRLPPRLAVPEDQPEVRAANEAIGESNRMTLLFQKPA
jgi:predicted methyltransferase